MGDPHEFTVKARDGEDVVTLRREEMLAIIHLVDDTPVDNLSSLLLSARRKLANKIPKRLRP